VGWCLQIILTKIKKTKQNRKKTEKKNKKQGVKQWEN
jgi:hypothetical protein